MFVFRKIRRAKRRGASQLSTEKKQVPSLIVYDDGNTAIRPFKTPDLFAKITDVNENLIKKF